MTLDWGNPIEKNMKNEKQSKTLRVLGNQLKGALKNNINPNLLEIAYEPIWAIGSGLTPSLDEIDENHNFIKNEIQGYENFKILYEPDYRQKIADSWPNNINDNYSRKDWGWKPKYSFDEMVEEMIKKVSNKLNNE